MSHEAFLIEHVDQALYAAFPNPDKYWKEETNWWALSVGNAADAFGNFKLAWRTDQQESEDEIRNGVIRPDCMFNYTADTYCETCDKCAQTL